MTTTLATTLQSAVTVRAGVGLLGSGTPAPSKTTAPKTASFVPASDKLTLSSKTIEQELALTGPRLFTPKPPEPVSKMDTAVPDENGKYRIEDVDDVGLARRAAAVQQEMAQNQVQGRALKENESHGEAANLASTNAESRTPVYNMGLSRVPRSTLFALG